MNHLKEMTGDTPDQSEVEKQFKLMDKDQSGDITKDECQKFLDGCAYGNTLADLLDL